MTQLSWSHFLEVMPIKDPVTREFYITMAAEERWSKRELQKQIDCMLYERTAISRKPEEFVKHVKYALSGEERQILMSRLRYEEIVPSPFTASSTPSATAAIALQIHAFLFQTKAALTVKGGSSYANREDELRKNKGYEEEIEEENRGISY